MAIGDTTDYTGCRFGRLTVLKNVGDKFPHWLCKCDCGNEVTLLPSRLTKYKSCGCLEKENREKIKERTTTHGMTNTILYSKYCSMKDRIHNPNYRYFNRYGGRGIKICPEWENSFEAFYKWAYENGYNDNKKGYEQTLDRIDVDGDYCPENCRWVSQKEQVWNRSNSFNIKDGDEYVSHAEFSRRHGINKDMFVYRRMKKGMTADEILREWGILTDDEHYMSTKEAAEFYNANEDNIRSWVRNGKLQGEVIGAHLRIIRNQGVSQDLTRKELEQSEKGLLF